MQSKLFEKAMHFREENIVKIDSKEKFHDFFSNKENMGLGFALNQARHVAAGDYFFNLENDWFFFYKSGWMEEGVLMFEKDEKGGYIQKKPWISSSILKTRETLRMRTL